MNEYTTILREHHLKATPQRLAMLESIDYYGHINIGKLYEDIQKKFSSISLATVYKNINAMTKNMILFEVKLPNEKSVYEIVKEKHSHLLCQSCGKVTDIETNINDILGDIEQKENFIIIQTDLVLSGICKECIN